MNLLAKLPLPSDNAPVDERPEEQRLAEEKKERILFHREKVRNGPAKFTQPSTGQIRRARKRATKSAQRKAFKGRVRSYFSQQQEIARLRGNLQFAGVIPFFDDTMEPTRLQAEAGLDWVWLNFREANDVSVMPALERALNRYQELTGAEQTPLSPAYRVPGVGNLVNLGDGIDR